MTGNSINKTERINLTKVLTAGIFILNRHYSSFAIPEHFYDLIGMVANEIDQFLHSIDFDQQKPFIRKVAENQQPDTNIHAQFLPRFHRNHQLPSWPNRGGPKAFAHCSSAYFFSFTRHNKLCKYYLIFPTNLSTKPSSTLKSLDAIDTTQKLNEPLPELSLF
jgi:hypothetical protein